MGRFTNFTDQDALFKEFYGKAGITSVNKKTPLASLLKKNSRVDWVGDSFVQPIRFGSGVGLGYRAEGENLPQGNAAPRGKAVFVAKKAYATAEYSRETIVASRNDKGAFASVTVDEVDATTEGFMIHNLERPLFGDSTGKLGEVTSSSGVGTVASPFVIVMATTGTNGPKYKAKNFPKAARLDIYDISGVYQMTVAVVSVSTTSVTATLIAQGAASVPAATNVLYFEGNINKEIVGLSLICPVSAGTLYGISQTTNPEFRGGVLDLAGSTLSIEDVNTAVESLAEESGESPTMGFCSHAAYKLLKNQTEDQKRYPGEKSNDKATIGFSGIEIIGDSGVFQLMPSQMCPTDDLYLLNDKYLQLIMRQDFGWFDDDGTILLRHPDKDIYQARYGGYFELFCSRPNAQYRIRNFSTT